MQTKKKIYHFKNKLPLNKFHQLKRSEKKDQQMESCRAIKKQIRDLDRLIENGKLNDEVKEIKMKQLEEKKALLGTKKVENQRQQKKIDYFARKYKKIKQVDLKKLKRSLNKLQKELESTDNREELLKREQDIYEKINYIKHYPKDQKYISLFGNNINDHAIEQQNNLLEKSKIKLKLMEAKKYKMIEENQKTNDDDFLMDEEDDVTNKKRLVDKQGKVMKYQKLIN